MSSAEFLVFSDLHAHNFPYAAKRVSIPGFGGLYNSRLRDTANVLDEIKQYALTNNVRDILFAGDLFHRRTSAATDVSNVITQRLRDMCDAGCDLYMIPGNHDYGDKYGFVHHLYGLDYEINTSVFSSGLPRAIHVLDEPGPGWETIETGLNVLTVPYTPDIEKARESLKYVGELADEYREAGLEPIVLLAHLGMQGAKVGSDYVLVSDSDIKTEDVPYDKFDACFFGHFHEHQQLFKNGWFVGSTHEHNWGDSGGKRGFLHVKIEDGDVSIKRVETAAPKFVQVKYGEEKSFRPVDFVKYIAPAGKHKEVKQELSDLGVTEYDIVEESDGETLDFALDVDKLDPESMLNAWVDATLPEDLDRDEVIKEGKKFLSKVS